MNSISLHFAAFVHQKTGVIREQNVALKLLADEKSRSKTREDELKSKLATTEAKLEVRDVRISNLVEGVKDQQCHVVLGSTQHNPCSS